MCFKIGQILICIAHLRGMGFKRYNIPKINIFVHTLPDYKGCQLALPFGRLFEGNIKRLRINKKKYETSAHFACTFRHMKTYVATKILQWSKIISCRNSSVKILIGSTFSIWIVSDYWHYRGTWWGKTKRTILLLILDKKSFPTMSTSHKVIPLKK